MTINSRGEGGSARRSLRAVSAEVGFHRLAEGSVLYRAEGTVVVATASVEETVPRFLEGSGRGWLTAEYQMHPRSGAKRREARDGRTRPLSGRTREIERLVGRSLRAALDLSRLGERTVVIDCDVLEADGGTRTASVTAGFIALAAALKRLSPRGLFARPPLRRQVAAVSVGLVAGEPTLDLDYAQDSRADVDLNLVATAEGEVVEVQGTAEGPPMRREQLDALIELGLEGVAELCALQRRILSGAEIDLDKLM